MELCQIPLVALVVWNLSQHVLYPGPRGNVGSFAQVLMSEYAIAARYPQNR